MRSPIRILSGLALALVAWPVAAQCPADTTTTATDDFTCYVATTGLNTNSGVRSSPMRDIQAAIDRAFAGTGFQSVRVFPGTYNECPYAVNDVGGTIVASDLDIVSDAFANNGTSTTTIIDGTGSCDVNGLPVVTLGDNGRLRGFTIKGGGDSGVIAFGHATIANNVIELNSTPFIGGGIYLETGVSVGGAAAEARIANNIVRDNVSELDGGGIFVLAWGDGLPSKVVLDANTVQDNAAGQANLPPAVAGERMYGGGIAVFSNTFAATDRSEVVITNNVIEGNEVAGFDNATPSYGGGLAVATYGIAVDAVQVTSSNIVRNNQAIKGYGGGIAALAQGVYPGELDQSVLVQSNAISTNTGEFGGGGIYALNLALGLDDAAKVVVQVLSNDLAGNVTNGAQNVIGVTGGGGIYAEFFNEQSAGADSLLAVNGNSLRNNTSASFGGGAALYARTYGEPLGAAQALPASSRLHFANNLLTGNSAIEDPLGLSHLADGGGIYLFALGQGGGASEVDLEFNTLVSNTADTGFSGGIALDAVGIAGSTSPIGSTDLDVSSSIFKSNGGFAVGGTAVPGVENTTVRIAYNDAFQNGAGPYAAQYAPGPGNLTVDPELDAFFVPLLCSPTIDAGDPTRGTYGSIDPNDDNGLQDERQPNGGRPNLGHTGLTFNATVTLPDANVPPDGLVDGVDILRLALSFASVSSNVDRYIVGADSNRDGDVDGFDLSYMAAWFGRVCP